MKTLLDCDLSIPEKRVVYGWHEGMLQHKNLVLVTHPEKPERITSIIEKLQEFNILERCTLIPVKNLIIYFYIYISSLVNNLVILINIKNTNIQLQK